MKDGYMKKEKGSFFGVIGG